MRCFVYPRGINGNMIGEILELLRNDEICYIDDNSVSENLEMQKRHIGCQDLVLIASSRYYQKIHNRLLNEGIASINGIEFCGKLLNSLINDFKVLDKCNFYIGIVISNGYTRQHFDEIDIRIKKCGFGIVYFVATRKLYNEYQRKGFCVLAGHAILEQINSVDMMLLANGEPTHKNIVSVDLTHNFQGTSSYLFGEFDRDFFFYASSSLNYRVCSAKKIERANRECHEIFNPKIIDLRLGYMKLSKDYKAYQQYITRYKKREEFVLLCFSFGYDVLMYRKLIAKIIQEGRKVVVLLHPGCDVDIIHGIKGGLESYGDNVLYENSFLSRFEMFASSLCLITDASSMGYTFPLTTAKPSIVFTYNKGKYFSTRFKNEHYFDDKLMYFCESIDQLKGVIDVALKDLNSGEYLARVNYYRMNECFNFFDAKEKLLQWIVDYFNKK